MRRLVGIALLCALAACGSHESADKQQALWGPLKPAGINELTAATQLLSSQTASLESTKVFQVQDLLSLPSPVGTDVGVLYRVLDCDLRLRPCIVMRSLSATWEIIFSAPTPSISLAADDLEDTPVVVSIAPATDVLLGDSVSSFPVTVLFNRPSGWFTSTKGQTTMVAGKGHGRYRIAMQGNVEYGAAATYEFVLQRDPGTGTFADYTTLVHEEVLGPTSRTEVGLALEILVPLNRADRFQIIIRQNTGAVKLVTFHRFVTAYNQVN